MKKVKAPAAPLQRRDKTGHLNAKYAGDLRARIKAKKEAEQSERGVVFLTSAHSRDALAEQRGESFVATATSGEDDEDVRDEVVTEESGGPFVLTTSATEFAHGTDGSNPPGAAREPFPKT
jgi:hypothetical protein